MKGMDNLQARGLVGLLGEWESAKMKLLVSFVVCLGENNQIE